MERFSDTYAFLRRCLSACHSSREERVAEKEREKIIVHIRLHHFLAHSTANELSRLSFHSGTTQPVFPYLEVKISADHPRKQINMSYLVSVLTQLSLESCPFCSPNQHTRDRDQISVQCKTAKERKKRKTVDFTLLPSSLFCFSRRCKRLRHTS